MGEGRSREEWVSERGGRRKNHPLIFLLRVNLSSSLFDHQAAQNQVLFRDLKRLKPLSFNAFRFNQQALLK
ncbi:hypothetical protein AFK68_22285 [Hydrocoleum sp. CS-953]|nr:hypothetical protein AFK68_22285 [Hydrocoleum sp. CS-953]